MQKSRGFDLDKKDAREMDRERAKKESYAGERRPKIKKGTSQKTIFQAAYKTNFADIAEAKEWESRYKEKLTPKATGDSVFHLLARKDDEAGMRWSPEKTTQFLNWALERHHDLLMVKNRDRYTPLHLAFMQNNDAFIEAVLKYPDLMNLGNVLTQTCQYGNSLHVAIKHKTRLIKLMIDKCADWNSLFTYRQDSTHDTPLHICMTMDLERDDEDEGEETSEADNTEYSDIEDQISQSHRDHSEDRSGVGKLDRERDLKKISRVTFTPKEDPNTPFSSARRGSQSFPGLRRARTTWSEVESPSHLALKVVRLLVEKHDPVLLQKNNESRTPYQERIYRLKEAHQVDGEKLQSLIADDPITSFIRSYCVRNFPRDKIMTCLYQPGQERHIEFDLGGFPHSSISEDYLIRLSKHLRFESILKYVAIPRLTLEDDIVRKKKSSSTTRKQGRSDLVAMFGWLKKNGVKKIVKVMVIDDKDPSHADSSIEDALKDFGVEIWDWKRLDLSTEVIHKTTNEVKEISLYSTGNNAVLMGWASQQGLSNRSLFPKLEKVNLFIRQGLEDQDRLKKYIDTFKTTITQANSKVKVHDVLDDKNVSFASEFKGNNGHNQSENGWINVLADFSKLLYRAKEFKRVGPVKIAIIDDGVDASLLSLDGKIAIGESFCPYANSSDLMSPYYVPAGNHGTVMATIICKICPDVKLYVARLDERQSAGGRQRQITPKSAADAIRWATNCGVDIISMSWTIETPVAGNQDMENLKSAVREADQKQILMFCSTSDQGSSTKDNCYPGDFEGCIMIGGANDETGDALAWVDSQRVKFLLPGTNAPFVNNEGRVVSYESGSSVATATASGLAGLLLFSSWVTSDGDNYFRSSEKMRAAFKQLAGGGKFPRVQDTIDKRFKSALRKEHADESSPRQPQSYELSRMEWDDRCMNALKSLMGFISPPL